MDRRNWLGKVCSALLVPLAWPAMRLFAQDAQEQATLAQRLKAGLLCRRQAEFDFVSLVANKVSEGVLPQDLVLNAMRYAIKKRPKFPFFYFQAVITRQAEALGVDLGFPVAPNP